jgi:two-component system, sensor histidine kinase and response regulator
MTGMTPDGIEPDRIERLRRAGGSGLVTKIVTMFVELGPGRLQRARDALASGSAHDLEHVCHSLKSSAAQVGAARLSSVCAELEELARRGELDRAASLVEEAERAFTDYQAWSTTLAS